MKAKCICEDFTITIRSENGAKFKRPFEIWTDTDAGTPNFFMKFHGVDQDLERFDEDQLKAVSDYTSEWWETAGH